jgi:uncharacterized protein
VGNPLKWILFLLLFLQAADCSAQDRSPTPDSLPRPVDYVNDYEHLFSREEQEKLDTLIHEFDQQMNIQIAIVTIQPDMTITERFDNYIHRILLAWGVGQSAGHRGIVIGISKGFRKIRIQKDAGIEKILSNTETKAIIDTAFLPYFRKDDYFGGTLNGLRTLIGRLHS